MASCLPDTSRRSPARHELVRETIGICDCGVYAGRSGIENNITEVPRHPPNPPSLSPLNRFLLTQEIAYSMNSTEIYSHRDTVSWCGQSKRRSRARVRPHSTVFQVINCTTMGAAQRLADEIEGLSRRSDPDMSLTCSEDIDKGNVDGAGGGEAGFVTFSSELSRIGSTKPQSP